MGIREINPDPRKQTAYRTLKIIPRIIIIIKIIIKVHGIDANRFVSQDLSCLAALIYGRINTYNLIPTHIEHDLFMIFHLLLHTFAELLILRRRMNEFRIGNVAIPGVYLWF